MQIDPNTFGKPQPGSPTPIPGQHPGGAKFTTSDATSANLTAAPQADMDHRQAHGRP